MEVTIISNTIYERLQGSYRKFNEKNPFKVVEKNPFCAVVYSNKNPE
jgi:hypothetical protein